ncbi:transcriptional regulator, TetR family [Parasphingorhabdus marina DSM 22363]|uniref:Transcriptional regulator, TetR family n=1 Tax=Parasphingorhabdus marina DSM 22363 TaxID=1123272 RepID=A0A1N6HFR0_9SPHN|nr:TetR/AcrR family transcriptional regulator [Parasphingorhabdus marina]SIO18593.1 transcriptional regulator, TetR family [Parasphingorhabdus marina DSM 22363]
MNTRTAILDLAEDAARQQGSNGFSIGRLAKSVGIQKASMFHHFPSKPDLLDAVFERYSQEIYLWFDDLDKKQVTGGERVSRYLDLTRDILQDGDSICLSIVLCVEQESLQDELVDEVRIFQKRNVKWLAQSFKAGLRDNSIKNVGSPKAEAAACLSLIDGALVSARLHNDVTHYDNAVKLLRSRLRRTGK